MRFVCAACREPTSVLVNGVCPTCLLLDPPRPRSFQFVLITDPADGEPTR